MDPRQRRLAMIVAIPGIAACVVALSVFFLEILHNRLPWGPLQTAREHYLAVGGAFSRGFATGFFLCFFLMVVAVVAGTWYEQRR